MKNSIKKSTFREVVGVTTMELPESNLIFNSQRVGPMNFNNLRNADYGKGFRMPIAPELVSLVYDSLKNQEYDPAKNVLRTMEEEWLIGNTAAHCFPEGMFAEDNPEMKDGKIIRPDYKTLEKKLGKHEERGVVFSDDKNIRFTPYNYKREFQSPSDLSKNTGIMTLFSGEENAEKLAMASENYKLKPYFLALSHVNLPKTRVVSWGPVMDMVSGGLSVISSKWGEEYHGYTFGVKK